MYEKIDTLPVTKEYYGDTRAEDSWVDPVRNQTVSTMSEEFSRRSLEIIQELCRRKGVTNPQGFILNTSHQSAPYSYSRASFQLECQDEGKEKPILIIRKSRDNRKPQYDPQESKWVNENDLLPRSEVIVRKLGYWNEDKAKKGDLYDTSLLVSTVKSLDALKPVDKRKLIRGIEKTQFLWLEKEISSEEKWQSYYQNASHRKDVDQCRLLVILLNAKTYQKHGRWQGHDDALARQGTWDIPAQPALEIKTEEYLLGAINELLLQGHKQWDEVAWFAVQTLGNTGGARALPAMFDYLKTITEPDDQVTILKALAKIGSPRVGKYLIANLKGDKSFVNFWQKSRIVTDLIKASPHQEGAKKAYKNLLAFVDQLKGDSKSSNAMFLADSLKNIY